MRRGEIWWVNFDSSVGGETQESRPAVITSSSAANQFLNRVQIVPLTVSTGKLYPREAYVTYRRKQSKATADQSTTYEPGDVPAVDRMSMLTILECLPTQIPLSA